MDGLGNVLSSSFYDGYGQGVGLVSGEPFGYGGQWGYYTDGEVGFTLLGLRYYDGGCGRFLTRDPWFEVSDNLYRYTENNPVNLHDPTGLVTALTECGNHSQPSKKQKPCPDGFQIICVTCYGQPTGQPAYGQKRHCSCYGLRWSNRGDQWICAIGGDRIHPKDCNTSKRL
jgi:RHS repeat-associated protein